MCASCASRRLFESMRAEGLPSYVSPNTWVTTRHVGFAQKGSPLVRLGLVANPATRIKVPRIERQEYQVLTPEEVARLVACIPTNWQAFVLVAVYGHLRYSELAH